MKSLSRALRTSTLTTVAAAAMLALTGPAALAASGDGAEVDVTHDCTSIDVSSTMDISNVVLEFADGDTQRFEDLPESQTGTFAGTGDDSGEVITTAWIKSGDNKSGDGPGFGERFDFDTTACEDDDDNGDDDNGDNDNGDDDNGDNGDNDNDNGDNDNGDNGDDDNGDDDNGDDDNGDNGDDDNGDDVQSDDDQQTPDAQVLNTGLERDDDTAATVDDDQQTPEAQVLSAGLERDDSGMRAADASDVQSAQQLPNAGADTPAGLAAALAALALGGTVLRRTSRNSA